MVHHHRPTATRRSLVGRHGHSQGDSRFPTHFFTPDGTFFTLSDVVTWLGITPFQLWMRLVGVFLFTVLLVLRLDAPFPWQPDWWTVFCPLLAVEALDVYYCLVTLIRALLNDISLSFTMSRLFPSFQLTGCVLSFELMTCLVCQGYAISHGTLMTPVFVSLFALLVRGCQQRTVHDFHV